MMVCLNFRLSLFVRCDTRIAQTEFNGICIYFFVGFGHVHTCIQRDNHIDFNERFSLHTNRATRNKNTNIGNMWSWNYHSTPPFYQLTNDTARQPSNQLILWIHMLSHIFNNKLHLFSTLYLKFNDDWGDSWFFMRCISQISI